MHKAYLSLLSGYGIWGLFPLYWSLLTHIPALEVTLHRIVWSVPVLIALVWPVAQRLQAFKAAWKQPRTLTILVVTALLITINWGVYVVAVAENRVVEASMGYFLSPLFNVLGGMLLFQERLDRTQWLAVGFAALGVAVYVLAVPTFPWLGLIVGISFSGYGLLRKLVDINAVPGLLVETLLIGPFALAVLAWIASQGNLNLIQAPIQDSLLMVLSGLVTVVPLALFTSGARALPMTNVGILFFITPSLQFISGVLILGESVNALKLLSYALIWVGVGFYIASLTRDKTA